MNFQAKLHKGTGDSFSDYETLSKVWLLYLEVKLK